MSVRRIAKLVGISPAAVSLALVGSARVSAATKRKVRQAAKKIGYRPNARLGELMSQMRMGRHQPATACLGAISFYEEARPWDNSLYLAGIYAGMAERADALGYRLEPFWLRAPGMTTRRLCGILDTRGVTGLLCLGSPNTDVDLPAEFRRYAIVTHGVSIRTPLHRVVTASFRDIWRAMNKVYERGYRRPGLAVAERENARSGFTYSSGYLGWCQHVLGTPAPLPILRVNTVESETVQQWLEEHEPDAMVFVHHHSVLPKLVEFLNNAGLRAPRDLGVAVLTQTLEGFPFSGLQQNRHLIGMRAVDMLVGSIMGREFGFPVDPCIQLIESRWIEGETL